MKVTKQELLDKYDHKIRYASQYAPPWMHEASCSNIVKNAINETFKLNESSKHINESFVEYLEERISGSKLIDAPRDSLIYKVVLDKYKSRL
jgi:hypothetical protein